MTDKKYTPTIAERIAKESRDSKRAERALQKESEAIRKGKGTEMEAGKTADSVSVEGIEAS